MTDLSKVQFLAAGLVHEVLWDLFTKEDLAQLSHCSVRVEPTTLGDEHALIADVNIYRKDDQTSTPYEIRVDFLQDQERKLTGRVEVSCEGRDILARQLDYIRGW